MDAKGLRDVMRSAAICKQFIELRNKSSKGNESDEEENSGGVSGCDSLHPAYHNDTDPMPAAEHGTESAAVSCAGKQ